MFHELDAELNSDPVLIAGPVADLEIDQIEGFAGFRLPSSYREFVKRYGAAIVGPFPVFGSGASEAMSVRDASVIDVTQRFRSDDWPATEKSLVISMDHAGNAFTMDASGCIYRFDHDSGMGGVIAGSFEGFLQWCLSR